MIKMILKHSIVAFLLMLSCIAASAQVDRREVRSGNRQFKKGSWQNAEIEYRKALVKDSLSFAANYNLANALYKEGNYEEAGKSLERLKEVAPMSDRAADYFYNQGNTAAQKKDWNAAVEAYRQSLLKNPGDMDAKENYAYAKLMLKNQKDQGQGGGNDQQRNKDQNKDQNEDKNKDQEQNQDQNKDQNQNQNQNQGERPGSRQGEGRPGARISPQQAQQMLRAIQAREKETQDKVNKEKAALMKSRQKEKNW